MAQLDDHNERFRQSWERMGQKERERSELERFALIQKELDDTDEEIRVLVAEGKTEQAQALLVANETAKEYWKGVMSGRLTDDGTPNVRPSGAAQGGGNEHRASERVPQDMNSILRQSLRNSRGL